MRNENILHLGIGGHLVALDKATGTELWRVKLRGSGFVTVSFDEASVYGSSYGEIFCLEQTTGQLRWHNKLKGLGTGFVTHAAFPFRSQPGREDDLIYLGIGGHAVALEKATGAEVWRAKLKGGNFVNLCASDGSIYATAYGELFCLEPATGELRWHNKLKGLGTGLLAFGNDGSIAAVAQEIHEEAARASAQQANVPT